MLPHAILICISLITSEIEGFTGLSVLLWIASLSPFPFSYWIISLHFELKHSLLSQGSNPWGMQPRNKVVRTSI